MAGGGRGGGERVLGVGAARQRKGLIGLKRICFQGSREGVNTAEH